MSGGGVMVARVAARRASGRWLIVLHGPAAALPAVCYPCGWAPADTRRRVRPAFGGLPVARVVVA